MQGKKGGGGSRTIGLQRGIGRRWHLWILVIAQRELLGLRRLLRLWGTRQSVAEDFVISRVGVSHQTG